MTASFGVQRIERGPPSVRVEPNEDRSAGPTRYPICLRSRLRRSTIRASRCRIRDVAYREDATFIDDDRTRNVCVPFSATSTRPSAPPRHCTNCGAAPSFPALTRGISTDWSISFASTRGGASAAGIATGADHGGAP